MYRVILVVDRSYGEKLRSLPSSVPMWVVDSETNMAIIRELWRERKSTTPADIVTSFQDDSTLSPERLAESIVETIELHHGFVRAIPP
jgi:hypothetical protein